MSTRTIRLISLAAFVLAGLSSGKVPAQTSGPTFTNHLAGATDPYLRQHAHNPVDWYPWGREAFDKARAEGKPIFLSIGYSTCYWCHVAETTIYSDPAIAALMNKWFVNIKVDREERPDVDRLYIVATEMLTQHGAWPNNLFLTPDGKPFYAGSYFPPKDGPDDEMGFPRVLAAIHDLWTTHRADKVEPAADEVFGALKKIAAAQRAVPPVPIAPEAWLKLASKRLLRGFDPVNGGFGSPKGGPKFPQTPSLDLLLAATQTKDAAARRALVKTLEAMAYGGIDDQIGGGFHRYAIEPTWTIPHFEKMLSDNAQLLSLYTCSYLPTRTPFLRDVALHIGQYLLRDMQAPDGGFYTAQDAEVAGVEGATYLWTHDQIAEELGPIDTERFFAVYELVPMPDIRPPGDTVARHPQGGVLRVRQPIDETVRRVGATDLISMQNALVPLRAELLALRKDRPQTAIDEKIVTSLNGLAIGALAQAGADLEQPDFVAAARKAAARIWATSFDPVANRVRHEIINGSAEVDGYLDDYAMLAEGFLSLADAIQDHSKGGDPKEADAWRRRAMVIADAMLARFAAPDGRLAAGAGDGLPLVLADDSDNDIASGTSAALALLLRLGERPDGGRFETAAAKLASAMSGRLAARPQAWPTAVAALARHRIEPAALAALAPAQPSMAATADVRGAPATSDHVHVSAKIEGDGIAVTLKVDQGYHVNAHKPFFDYLVPTDVSFGPLKPTAIDYPKAVRFKSAFAPDGLDVYEGDVRFVARFPAGMLSGVMGLEGQVTTQACDAKTCLPPATLPIRVVNPG